jgi:deoxyribodipyrimidine photolyase
MGDPNSIIKKIASEFYSFTTHIYSDLKAGKQEAAYRDAIQAEFQLRGYAVQVEVPVTYKYRTTA